MRSILRRIFLVALLSPSVLFVSQALIISPARLDLRGDPGQVVIETFNIVNDEANDVVLFTSPKNFEARGDSGVPTFTDVKDGLASWISVDQQIVVKRGETKKVEFKVIVPESAQPAGYFAGLLLRNTPPSSQDGQGEVALGAAIGPLLFFRVNGEITEAALLKNFETYKTTKSESPSKVFNSLPVVFRYQFQNGGGDRINPYGSIVITNTFGFETTKLAANPTQGNVLPGQLRTFSNVWGDDVVEMAPTNFFKAVLFQLKHFALGYYSAEVDLNFGTKGDGKTVASVSFFVLPWQLISVILIGLLILWRVLKLYNRWIIKQARSR